MSARSLLATSSDAAAADSISLERFDRDEFMQIMLLYALPAAVALAVRHAHTHAAGTCAASAARCCSLSFASCAPCLSTFLLFQSGTVTLYRARFHVALFPAAALRQWIGPDSVAKPPTAAASSGAGAIGASSEAAELDSVRALVSGTGSLGEGADECFEHYLAWIYPAFLFLMLLVPISICALLAAAVATLDHMFAVAIAFVFFAAMILTWTMMRWRFEQWRMNGSIRLLFAILAAATAAFEL